MYFLNNFSSICLNLTLFVRYHGHHSNHNQSSSNRGKFASYLVSHISYRPNERPIPSLVFSWQLFQQSYVPRFDNEASFGHNGGHCTSYGTGARAGPRTQWI